MTLDNISKNINTDGIFGYVYMNSAYEPIRLADFINKEREIIYPKIVSMRNLKVIENEIKYALSEIGEHGLDYQSLFSLMSSLFEAAVDISKQEILRGSGERNSDIEIRHRENPLLKSMMSVSGAETYQDFIDTLSKADNLPLLDILKKEGIVKVKLKESVDYIYDPEILTSKLYNDEISLAVFKRLKVMYKYLAGRAEVNKRRTEEYTKEYKTTKLDW